MFAIIVLNFFLVNFFAGALCDHFIEAKDNANPVRIFCISEDQQKWIDYQKMILRTNGENFENLAIINNKVKLFFFRVIKSCFFEKFKMIFYISNIIIISLPYDGSGKQYNDIILMLDQLMIILFIIEFLITLIAKGISGFFNSFLNKIDFILICFSIIEIILIHNSDFRNFIKIRPFRILRVFKLLQSFPNIRKLIDALIFSLPSLLNVGALYLTIHYIYAVFGVYLFKNVRSGTIIDDYNNFQNVGFALITCFRMITGENWWFIMYDCYNLSDNCVPDETCGHCK